MKDLFLGLLFYVGLLYYIAFLVPSAAALIEEQLRDPRAKPPDPFLAAVAALSLVVASWLLLWGRLPFPFFGLNR